MASSALPPTEQQRSIRKDPQPFALIHHFKRDRPIQPARPVPNASNNYVTNVPTSVLPDPRISDALRRFMGLGFEDVEVDCEIQIRGSVGVDPDLFTYAEPTGESANFIPSAHDRDSIGDL